MWWEKIWYVLFICWVIMFGARIFAGIKKGEDKIWSWAVLFAALAILIALPILLSIFVLSRTPVYRSSIDNNLKQWALIFRMYANESPGELYPPLTQQEGLWVPDLHVLYPEYLTDTLIVRDPDSLTEAEIKTYYQDSRKKTIDLEKTTALMAQTYLYTGWVIHNDADVQLMEHYRNEQGTNIGDIESENTHLYWMREDVEDTFITGASSPRAKALAQASIPVMIARPRSPKNVFSRWWEKVKRGHWEWKPESIIPVLFLDGHIEDISLSEAPDYIKALVELFPEPLEGESNHIDERDK